MNKDERIDKHMNKFKMLLLELVKIRRTKMEDYGYESWSANGIVGLYTLVSVKFRRLTNLIGFDGFGIHLKKPNYESIEDTLIDLANYTLMLVMMFREWRNQSI